MESREELVNQIEEARKRLNGSIDGKESYDLIYRYSVELDRLIEQYMDAGILGGPQYIKSNILQIKCGKAA